jgi:type IV secretory pathway ATPase VirB11/archaellum biosynthesis ATPase
MDVHAHHSVYDSTTSQHKNYTLAKVKALRAKLYEVIARGERGAGQITGVPANSDKQDTGEDNRYFLEKLDGDPLGRLAQGVRDQETIVVCGPPIWERIDLLNILAKSIPENRRVIVLVEDRAKSDPGLREDALPRNHVVLYYNIPGVSGVSLVDIATAALNMAGDYLIVPYLRYGDIEVFQRYIAHRCEGIIVAVDAFEKDEAVRSIADVLIGIVSNKLAPRGIGSVWACQGPISLQMDR